MPEHAIDRSAIVTSNVAAGRTNRPPTRQPPTNGGEVPMHTPRRAVTPRRMAHPAARDPEWMTAARNAAGHFLLRAAIACGDFRPTPAEAAYFRSVIEEDIALETRVQARIDALANEPGRPVRATIQRVPHAHVMPIRSRRMRDDTDTAEEVTIAAPIPFRAALHGARYRHNRRSEGDNLA